MKQKNLILMVVAVGCGLIAAFLTSQVSGRQKPDAQLAEIIVAAKELTPGTKFTKDSIKDQIKRKKVNVADVPQNAVMEESELDDKTLVRSLRADDVLTTTDTGKFELIQAPPGYSMVGIKLPIDKFTQFVKPTSRVDLLGTLTSHAGKVHGNVLIPDMLVMAVDLQTVPESGKPDGSRAIQVVTLAALTDEARLIRMAETAGVQLSFILRSEATGPSMKPANWDVKEVIKWINKSLNDELDAVLEVKAAPVAPTAPQTTKIPVPVEDLPAGTELTQEVLESKFKTQEHLTVPDGALADLKPYIGQFLQKSVYRDQFVPKSFVGAKKPEEPKKPKASPSDDDSTPKPEAKPEVEKKLEPVAEKRKPTVDRSFVGPNGAKVYRYEKQRDGEWKLLGEVLPDGTVNGVQAPPAPAPAAPAPMPNGTPEPRIT